MSQMRGIGTLFAALVASLLPWFGEAHAQELACSTAALPSAGSRPLPQPDLDVTKLTDTTARAQFVSRISPAALLRAIESGERRGWRRTNHFLSIRVGGPDVEGIRPVALQQSWSDWSGELNVWEWDTGSPDVWGATIQITDSTGATVTYNHEYNMELGDVGEPTYHEFLAYRDRDGREFIREANTQKVPTAPSYRLLRATHALQSDCAQQRREWRQCVSECTRGVVVRTLFAGGAGAVAALKMCTTTSLRSGVLGPYASALVFVGCELGSGGLAAGIWMIREYQTGPCDGPGQCGAAPDCP